MNTYTVTWKIQNLKAKDQFDAISQVIELIDGHGSTFEVTDEITGKWRTYIDPRSYPREMWKQDVACGDTDLGYQEWLELQTEV
jgi:hypothetical protein